MKNPSAQTKVPPNAPKPLTPAQNQGITCAAGAISKVGKVLKIIKDGKVVQILGYIQKAGNGLVIGKEVATGAWYEVAWDFGELIPRPPGTGQFVSCLRVLDKIDREQAEKMLGHPIPSSEFNNKVGPVKIPAPTGTPNSQGVAKSAG
uniref:hypothetical protein n=1 Tax=Streptomyces achromogenes TaxID=67255 RepID=UPI003F49B23F